MSFVQLPGLDDRQEVAVHLVEDVLEGVDGALQIGGVADIEIVSAFLQELAAVLGFLDAFFREVDVGPSGEEVELVPLALAVTD